jgi:hypothetical protein
MFQAMGHPVSKLKRVAIGPISDPKLTPGVWRELTKQEVKMLETMKEMKPVKPRRLAKPPQTRKKTSTKAPAKKRSGAAAVSAAADGRGGAGARARGRGRARPPPHHCTASAPLHEVVSG